MLQQIPNLHVTGAFVISRLEANTGAIFATTLKSSYGVEKARAL